MKRMLAALAMCGAVLAATACSADEEPEESTDATSSEAEEAIDAAEDAEGDSEAASDLGNCGDVPVTGALADLIDAAGVEFSLDDSYGDTISCTWDTGSDVGPIVVVTASPTVQGSAMSVELLESMGQQVIDDSRFEQANAIPTVVLGCEDGDASGLMGCAVAVYGTAGGADVTVQALLSDVTQEQIVDAAWALTESFNR